MLDYRIKTFLTLYQQMNYRKTAQILNMTQPGVTQHIQYLEKYYGVKLFHYDGRSLRRTESADALKRHVEGILAEEKTLREAFSEAEPIHLSVGATKTIGEFVLGPALRRFLAAGKGDLDFVIDNTENLLEQLEQFRLDFALVEGVFDKSRYGYHLYRKEAFVGICAKEHPFAGKTVPLAAVFEQTLVTREPGSGTRRILEQAVCDRGFSMNSFARRVSVSSFSVITDIVARGGGITFGYAPVAAQSGLSTFQAEDMEITGEFNFVYCSEKDARKKIGLFFGENLPFGA